MTTLETLLGDPDSAGVWHLVPERSAVAFKVKNMWGLLAVKGEFTDLSGDGELTNSGAVVGRVDIQVDSLRTGIGRRDHHLRSADFFDAEQFPQISVVVTELRPTSGRNADLRAEVTVRGTSVPITLPVTITELGDGSVRMSGEAQVDRSQFGLGWNVLGAIGATAAASVQAVFERAAP